MKGLRRPAHVEPDNRSQSSAAPQPPQEITRHMKAGIHPKYQTAKAVCACGNTFTVGSTKGDLRVDVCAKCHPFYTGQQRILDTAGRVERFRKRFNIADAEEA